MGGVDRGVSCPIGRLFPTRHDIPSIDVARITQNFEHFTMHVALTKDRCLKCKEMPQGLYLTSEFI